MTPKPLRGLTAIALLALLTGCPGTPATQAPTASVSPGATTAPASNAPGGASTAPSTPATPGEAMAAYAQARDAVNAKGYTASQLYRIEANLANAAGTQWEVYLYTPSDAKSWQVYIAPGQSLLVNEMTLPAKQYKPIDAFDVATLKVDSGAALQASGDLKATEAMLQSGAAYKASTGKEATNPVWVFSGLLNSGSKFTSAVDAKTGQPLP
jgi:hypothetical protein